MANKNINLIVDVQDSQDNTQNIYKKNFLLYVKQEFIEWTQDKKHNLNNHTIRYKEKIKFNHFKEKQKATTKRSIYYVDYWINIGSEINWIRPSIVYKDSKYSYWEDLIVIPLTSDKADKSVDSFDIEIQPDTDNNLKNISHAKLRQMRCISKKRIENYVGKIVKIETKDQIQNKLIDMFGMKI